MGSSRRTSAWVTHVDCMESEGQAWSTKQWYKEHGSNRCLDVSEEEDNGVELRRQSTTVTSMS